MFLGGSRKTNIWGELGRAWQERGECFWRVVDTPVNTIKDEFLCEVRWKEWHPICKFSLIKFAFSAGIMLPSTWENLSRCSKKFNTCLEKKLPLAMDCRQSKHSQIIYIFFNFGCGFCGFFPILFPKAPASFWKKNWTNYCCIVSYIYELKKCVSDFYNLISNWRY